MNARQVGWYSLLGSPIGALAQHTTSTTTLPDRTVNGSTVMPWCGRAYELYVDRAPSDLGGFSLVPYTRAAAPIDAAARSVHLRLFVDTQSVEVFVNAGYTVLSQQVHFADGDAGISFYADGGPATFSGITIRSYQ